jgi:hypothetical protein
VQLIQLLQLSTFLQVHAPGMYRPTVSPRSLLMLARHAQGLTRSAALKCLQALSALESSLASGRASAGIFEKPLANSDIANRGPLWSLLSNDVSGRRDRVLPPASNIRAVNETHSLRTSRASTKSSSNSTSLSACLFLLQNFADDDHPDVRCNFPCNCHVNAACILQSQYTVGLRHGYMG